jgi:hypothetical protein
MSTKLKAFTTTDKIEYKNFNDLSCDELEYFITDRQSAKLIAGELTYDMLELNRYLDTKGI